MKLDNGRSAQKLMPNLRTAQCSQETTCRCRRRNHRDAVVGKILARPFLKEMMDYWLKHD